MKRCSFRVVVCLGAVLAALPVSAVTPDEEKESGNPFRSIVERNVFGIKPPPPPAEEQPPEAPPGPPPAKVVLTGILSVFGPPRALLEVAETAPGKQPNTIRPILREGERDGAIEVVSIDVEKNMVRIKNGNIETNLTFDVLKQNAAPAMAATPPALNKPAFNVTPSTGAAVPTASAIPTVGSNGRRSITLAGAQPVPATPAPGAIGGNSGMLAMGSSSYGAGTGLQIPPREVRGNPAQPQQQEQPIDGASQWVQMKAQEQAARQRNIPYPPTPPIPGIGDPTAESAPPPDVGGNTGSSRPPFPAFPPPPLPPQ